jgi:hypothetical protein
LGQVAAVRQGGLESRVGVDRSLGDRAPGVTGYTTFTGQIAQQNVVIYGGQVGLNVALH